MWQSYKPVFQEFDLWSVCNRAKPATSHRIPCEGETLRLRSRRECPCIKELPWGRQMPPSLSITLCKPARTQQDLDGNVNAVDQLRCETSMLGLQHMNW